MNLIEQLKCANQLHGCAKYVCFNEFCLNNRICCFECIKNGDHTTHLKDQQEIEKLSDFLEDHRNNFEELIQQIQLINVKITNSFSQLLQGLKIKYQLPAEELSKFDAQKLSQAIDQIIKYKDITKNILEDINHSSKNLMDQLNKYSNEFVVDEIYKQNQAQQKQQQINELFQKGQKLYQEHNYKEAIQYFNKVLQINPDDFQSLHLIAECLRMLGNYQDAIIMTDKALQINQNKHELLFIRAEVLRGLGRYNDAIIQIDKILQIDSNNIQSIITKAECLKMLNKYNDTIIYTDKVLQINPNNLFSLIIKSQSLKMIGQYNDAIIWANKALYIDSNNICSLITKTECLISIGNYNDAIACVDTGLQIDPSNFILQKLKTQSLNILRNTNKTNKFIQKSVKTLIFNLNQSVKKK